MVKATRKIFRVKDLVPADYNPRKINKKSLTGLTKSLDKFGYLQDIIVNIRDQKNKIVGGHQRLVALSLPPEEEIECTVVDLSELQEKALNIALNNKHTSGEYDTAGLEKILTELSSDFEEFDELNFDDLSGDFFAKGVEKLDELYTDLNCEMAIVPEFFENHQCFIIVTHNKIDENFVREKLNLTENRTSLSGDKKIRKSNIIDIEELRKLWTTQ